MMDQISQDIKDAMKAQDKIKLNALRYVKKLLIENKTSVKPQNELDVVISHAKKLKESAESFPANSPQQNELLQELQALSSYLPSALTEQEVVALIEDLKGKHPGAAMGIIMKELTPQIKGRFDGKLASDLVKKMLGN